MSFNTPQGFGGNNNQNNQPASRPRGPLGLLIASAVLLIVGLAWLTLFQNNLNEDSASFQYWAPYIPLVLGAIGAVIALNKYGKNRR